MIRGHALTEASCGKSLSASFLYDSVTRTSDGIFSDTIFCSYINFSTFFVSVLLPSVIFSSSFCPRFISSVTSSSIKLKSANSNFFISSAVPLRICSSGYDKLSPTVTCTFPYPACVRRSQNCPAPFLPPMRINARLAGSSGSHRRFITRSTDNSLPCAE